MTEKQAPYGMKIPTIERTQSHTVEEGYISLFDVLMDALDQAQTGKGHKRHSNGHPFTQQPLMKVADMVGEGFLLGQAMKKVKESINLDDDSKINERLGAINYLAASIVRIKGEEYRS